MEISQSASLDDLARALAARLSLYAGGVAVPLMVRKQKKLATEATNPATVVAISQLLTQKSNACAQLSELKESVIGNCQKCKLHSERRQVVFGIGSKNAELVFVGEAPGAEEDEGGEPFVGRSGKLLTKMIEAMGLSREQVYICNVIKCRPPENRNPEADEIVQCEPFLKAQITIIKPKVIVALGRFACKCLVQSDEPISQIRGRWSKYEGVDLMPTFHPAYLLRNPSKKKEVWEDLQAVMGKLKLNDTK